MRPPLTTSITGPSTVPSASLIFSIVPPRPLVLRPLLAEQQPAFLVLLLEDQGLDLVADGDDLVRVDVVADAQLTSGDDPFALVADVEQDFVLVDLDDGAGDELAVLDVDERAVDGVGEGHAEIVGDDLAGVIRAILIEGAPLGFGGIGVGGVGQGGNSFRRDAEEARTTSGPLEDTSALCVGHQVRRAITKNSADSVLGVTWPYAPGSTELIDSTASPTASSSSRSSRGV